MHQRTLDRRGRKPGAGDVIVGAESFHPSQGIHRVLEGQFDGRHVATLQARDRLRQFEFNWGDLIIIFNMSVFAIYSDRKSVV